MTRDPLEAFKKAISDGRILVDLPLPEKPLSTDIERAGMKRANRIRRGHR